MNITDERLKEARELLHDTEELSKKYPNLLSLKFNIKQWKQHIADLEKNKENNNV